MEENTISTEHLNDLLLSKIPEVADAARRANELIIEYQSHQISKSEFEELIDDLTNIDKIDRSMISLERYNELMTALKIIVTLKTLIPMF
jgi:transcriptional regulator of nitric oxide reductase